jgi:hypothetical protein
MLAKTLADRCPHSYMFRINLSIFREYTRAWLKLLSSLLLHWYYMEGQFWQCSFLVFDVFVLVVGFVLFCGWVIDDCCNVSGGGIRARLNIQLYSVLFCSATSKFWWMWAWIYMASHVFMMGPFWHCFSRLSVDSCGPNSCLLFIKCMEYAEIGLLCLI